MKDKEATCERVDKAVMHTRIHAPIGEQAVTIVQGFKGECLKDYRNRIETSNALGGLDESASVNILVETVREWNDVWNYVADHAGSDYLAKDGFKLFMKNVFSDEPVHPFCVAARFL